MADTTVHVDDERAQIVGQDDFPALVRALRRAQGFALYFVECNVPAYRNEVADAVRARLDRPVVDVRLGTVDRRSERPSIDAILERHLADAPDEAVVFVWELEWLLPTSEVDRAVTQATLEEVNWRRGTYADLGRPLVVWLPEYAVRFLARNAPDFFDWNSGLYVFDTPASDRPDLLDTSFAVLDEERTADSLPTEEKRRREAYLKSLLEEYSGDTEFDRSARAELVLRLAELHRSRGTYDRARSRARQALDLSKAVESQRTQARASYNLAMITLQRGHYEEALEKFEEVLRINQEIGDRKGEAAARHNLASIALNQGNYEEAEEEFEEALRIRQEIGDRAGEATTRHQMASIALQRDRYEKARSKFEEALRINQDIGNRSGEASTRHNLASIALNQGSHEEARFELEEALQIDQKIGDRKGEARTRHNLASLALKKGNYEEAEEEFKEALRICQEIGDRAGEASAKHQLASIALERDHYEEARSKFGEALRIEQETGDQSGEASTRHELARIAQHQGDYEKARFELEEALRINQDIGNRSKEASTLSQLGILAAGELDRPKEGLRLLHVSYAIFISIEHAEAEQILPLVQGLVDELGYDEDEWQEDAEYALQSYAEDRGWSLIQAAFPDADVPDDIPPPD